MYGKDPVTIRRQRHRFYEQLSQRGNVLNPRKKDKNGQRGGVYYFGITIILIILLLLPIIRIIIIIV